MTCERVGTPTQWFLRDLLHRESLRRLVFVGGLALTVLGLAGSMAIFVMVQVLTSYPFYGGVFGDAALTPWTTYTEALELFGSAFASGIFLCSFARQEGMPRRRVIRGISSVLLTLGALIALTTYLETVVLWGEILPGIHLWPGLPGGGGYPWASEQVAYNLCFLGRSASGDCLFLNYGELFWLSLGSFISGYVLRNS